MSLQEARDLLAKQHCLKPDRRFLLAIGYVHSLLSGKSFISPEISFKDGRWHISYRRQPVGSVSEFATFNDMFSVLSQWAKRVAGEYKYAFDKSPNSVKLQDAAPSHLISELEALNKRWQNNEHRLGDLLKGTEGLIWLSVQNDGLFDTSDVLKGRALAMCAISSAVAAPDDIVRMKAMLAQAMNYDEDASHLSRSLATADPVKSWIENRAVVMSKPEAASDLSAIINLIRISTHEPDKWEAKARTCVGKEPGLLLPVLMTRIGDAHSETEIPLAHTLMAVSLRELQGQKQDDADARTRIALSSLDWTNTETMDKPEGKLQGLLEDFERALAKYKVSADGFFVDRETVASYYRTCFYSGVRLLAHSQLRTTPSGQSANALVKALHTDRPGAPFELESWLKNRVNFRQQSIGQAAYINDFGSYSRLGAPAVIDMLHDIAVTSDVMSSAHSIVVARKLIACADARPEISHTLAEISQSYLLDMSLADRLFEYSRRSSPRHIDLEFITNAMKLRMLSRLSNKYDLGELDFADKFELLQYRLLQGSNLSTIEGDFRRLMALAPDQWKVVEAYTDLLVAAGKFEEAIGTINHWLARDKHAKSDERSARLALANAYYKKGDPAKGLSTLAGKQGGELLETMTIRALLLDALGREKEALQWADEALARYPQSKVPIYAMLQIFWHRGYYDRAANLLRMHPPSPRAWRKDVAPIFLAAFKSNPHARKLALSSLIDNGFGGGLAIGQFVLAAFEMKKPDLAFEIYPQVQYAPGEKLNSQMFAYKCLKEWKDEKTALNWLKERVKPANRFIFAETAMTSGQFELLWEIEPERLSAEERKHVWLCRAAASLLNRDAAYGAQLNTEFSPGNDLYHHLGRYLLGLEDGNALHSMKLSRAELCNTAFFTGFKDIAKASVPPVSACVWYSVATDSEMMLPGFWLSFDWLKRVDRLLADRLVPPSSLKELRISPAGKKSTFYNVDPIWSAP